MTPVLPIVLLLLLAGVDLWVYRDAQAHDAHGRPVVASIGPIEFGTPDAWTLGCIVVFVVCFPLYLAARNQS